MFLTFHISFLTWTVLVSHRPEQARISRDSVEIHSVLAPPATWVARPSSLRPNWLLSCSNSWHLVCPTCLSCYIAILNVQKYLRWWGSFYSFFYVERQPLVSPTSSWTLQDFASVDDAAGCPTCFDLDQLFPHHFLKWLHFQKALLADWVTSPIFLILLIFSAPITPISLKSVPKGAADYYYFH